MTTVKQNLINVLGVSEDKVDIRWSLTEQDIVSPDINRLESSPSENGIVISIPSSMVLPDTTQGINVVVDLNWIFNNVPQFSEWNDNPCKLTHLTKLSYLFLKLPSSKNEVIEKALMVLESSRLLEELNTVKIGDYEISYAIPYVKCSDDEFFERFVGIKPITKELESDNNPVNEELISEVPDIDLAKIPNSDNEIVNVVMKDGKYILEFRKEFLSRRDLVNFTTKLLNL